MPYTTINKSTDNFNTVTYTGNGSTQSITGVGFQPDWCWIKRRNGTASNELYDAVRGVGKVIYSDAPDAQVTHGTSYFNSFDSDGFSFLGGNSGLNGNSDTYAAWNWKANGAGSANTDGTINSTVSANQTAGFSIVKWVGTGANGTIGHGLNAVPKMVIVKCLDAGVNWFVYHQATGNTKELYLDSNSAPYSGTTAWNSTTPTSSVVYLGAHDAGANKSGDDQIAYCFAEKAGYSKFGSYYGNGSSDGAFVYTGFRPEFTLIKPSSATQNWQIHDTKRDGYNVKNDNLAPNNASAEADNQFMDILSNGFKLRSSTYSASSTTYIYIAFGQSLVGSNNVPNTAR